MSRKSTTRRLNKVKWCLRMDKIIRNWECMMCHFIHQRQSYQHNITDCRRDNIMSLKAWRLHNEPELWQTSGDKGCTQNTAISTSIGSEKQEPDISGYDPTSQKWITYGKN